MQDFFRSIEPTYISKNVEYEKKCDDGRMFNNCLLYCEGAHKPKWRGWLHVLAIFMFPYIFWKFYELTAGTDNFYLAMFCVFTGFIPYSICIVEFYFSRDCFYGVYTFYI